MIWKKISQKYFKDCICFCGEKEFWSKKDLGKKLYTAEIKRKVWIKPIFTRCLNRVQVMFL